MTQSHDDGVSLTPPPSYSRRASCAELVFTIGRFGGAFVFCLALVGTTLASMASHGNQIPTATIQATIVTLLLAGLVAAWFIARAWYAYTHNIISVTNTTASMRTREKGPLLLGLNYSSDDAIQLLTMGIQTPKRKWWQRKFMFNCDDMILHYPQPGLGEKPRPPVVLRNLKDADQIGNILLYVQSMPSTQVRLAKENNRLQHENNNLMRQFVASQAQQADMLTAFFMNTTAQGRTPASPANPRHQPSPSSIKTPIAVRQNSDGVYTAEGDEQ